MNKTTFDINTIDEYIGAIETIHSYNRSSNTVSNMYFRGQNKRYLDESTKKDSIIASGHRDYGEIKQNKLILSEDKVKMYYRLVANQLTQLEADNFLAYCQHHGLHTSLIDITADSIAALYFAVQNEDKDKDENEAVIYIFDESNMIDVSEDVINNKGSFDIFDLLLSEDAKAIEKLMFFYEQIERRSGIFYTLFIDLIDSIIGGIHDNYNHQSTILFEQIKSVSSEINRTCDFNYIEKLIEQLKNLPEITKLFHTFYEPYANYLGETSAHNYTEHLRTLVNQFVILYPWYVFILKSHIEYNRGYFKHPAPERFSIPRLPNFIYKPTVIYDRMLAQSGSFIIQGKFDSHVKNTIEDVIPDYVINVKDKNRIRKSLKHLGVNRTKYFNDPDNLADYLNKHYYQ